MSDTDALLDDLDRQMADSGIGADLQKIPEFCYYESRFYTPADNGIWISMPKSDAILLLKLAGVSTDRDGGSSEMDILIGETISGRSVSYAGLLAGCRAGIHEIEGGKRILVTESPAIVSPVAGEWPVLRSLIEGLFGAGEEHRQTDHLYGWLQVFLQSLHTAMEEGTLARAGMPGQALVIAGPRDCGKTLLTSVLVELVGGRRADPFAYMKGATDFNGELAEAEFLVIDDQPASKSPRDRQHLTTKIKEFTVTGTMRVHAKYMKPVMLRPCQRLVILTNNEPENLLVLPVIEPSVEDKLIILNATAFAMPMPTGTHAERGAFWETLMSELPAFHHFLVEEFEIPGDLRSGRFGVTHYHAPEIVEALGDLSAESRAIAMIDELFARGLLRTGRVPSKMECMENAEMAGMVDSGKASGAKPWKGTAREFESTMRVAFERWEAERLFPYDNSGGQLLGRLAMEYPGRVSKGATVRGTARWEINPPDGDPD